MTVVSIIPPDPEPVTRAWGAYTDTHSYRVDVTVRATTCDEPAQWLTFRFAGEGELCIAEFRRGASDAIRRAGCKLLLVTLTKITDAEYLALGEQANVSV